MSRRLPTVLLTLLITAQASAQVHIPDTIPGKGFVIGQLNLAKHIMDFFLDKRDEANATKLDTAYVGNYPEKLMFSAGLTTSGGQLRTFSENGGYELNSDMSRSISLRACYRGLAISFSANPFNMFGNSDSEFDISLYGDKTVFDFMYQNSETLNGQFTSTNTEQTDSEEGLNNIVEKGMINRRTLTFGGMYVFNSRRFSYAAAFDQTCMQKRSCGSVLLGANYIYNRLRINFQEFGNVYIKTKMIGIGGGYAYNFVLPHNWLISASGLMEIGAWVKNRSELSQTIVDIYNKYRDEGTEELHTEETFSFDMPPVILTSRTAFIHQFGRYYIGLTGIATMHFEKNEGDIDSNIVFVSDLLFGIRL